MTYKNSSRLLSSSASASVFVAPVNVAGRVHIEEDWEMQTPTTEQHTVYDYRLCLVSSRRIQIRELSSPQYCSLYLS